MFRVLGILAVLGLAFLSISGSEAEDRDEFYAIARGDYGRPRPVVPSGGWWGRPMAPTVSHLPAAPRQMATRPATRQAAAIASSDRTSQAFCVRSCDGYFFPIGASARGEGRQAQAAACNAMCPGATMRLFSSRNGSIETARTDGGQLYTATATAFRHRERLVSSCSCQGDATRGLARLALSQDHTLRTGDAVVMDKGVRIFRDGGRFPYQPRDFVTAQAYGRLSPDMRRRVREIEEASLGPRLRVAGIAPTAANDVFDRAPRLEVVREMMARAPVREIAIVNRIELRSVPQPLPRPREAPR
jgi:hypothetical protein